MQCLLSWGPKGKTVVSPATHFMTSGEGSLEQRFHPEEGFKLSVLTLLLVIVVVPWIPLVMPQ